MPDIHYVLRGPAGERLYPDGATVIIGRKESTGHSYTFAEAHLSRRHAELRTEKQPILRDLGSSNGTLPFDPVTNRYLDRLPSKSAVPIQPTTRYADRSFREGKFKLWEHEFTLARVVNPEPGPPTVTMELPSAPPA